MGVRGLYPYISKSPKSYLWHRIVPISSYQNVVIDTYNWLLSIYTTKEWDVNYGGDYISLGNHIRKFINQVRQKGLEPVFVTDGVLLLEKLPENLARKKSKQNEVYKNFDNKRPGNASNVLSLYYVMSKVCDDNKVEHHIAKAEGDPYTAFIANQKDNALLITRDNDYYIFPYQGQTSFLHLDEFYSRDKKSINQLVRVFDQKLFCEYHECKAQDLVKIPLACGNDFTKRNNMKWDKWGMFVALAENNYKQKFIKKGKFEEYQTNIQCVH